MADEAQEEAAAPEEAGGEAMEPEASAGEIPEPAAPSIQEGTPEEAGGGDADVGEEASPGSGEPSSGQTPSAATN